MPPKKRCAHNPTPETALFYAAHSDEVKEVVSSFDAKDAAYIPVLRRLFKATLCRHHWAT